MRLYRNRVTGGYRAATQTRKLNDPEGRNVWQDVTTEQALYNEPEDVSYILSKTESLSASTKAVLSQLYKENYNHYFNKEKEI